MHQLLLKGKTGKKQVMDGAEWRLLMTSIPAETVKDLRDRELIAVLITPFARPSRCA